MARRELHIHARESTIAQQRRAKFAGLRIQLRRRGQHQRLVASFIIASRAIHDGRQYCAAVGKFHYLRHMKDVLVESGEEKYSVFADWSAQGESELLLPVRRLERDQRGTRVKSAVAQIIKAAAVQMIAARFRH